MLFCIHMSIIFHYKVNYINPLSYFSEVDSVDFVHTETETIRYVVSPGVQHDYVITKKALEQTDVWCEPVRIPVTIYINFYTPNHNFFSKTYKQK
jgi:hypothetical protein